MLLQRQGAGSSGRVQAAAAERSGSPHCVPCPLSCVLIARFCLAAAATAPLKLHRIALLDVCWFLAALGGRPWKALQAPATHWLPLCTTLLPRASPSQRRGCGIPPCSCLFLSPVCPARRIVTALRAGSVRVSSPQSTCTLTSLHQAV